MQLIIATPSPYARKVRVALIEKNIEFETLIDNPWQPAARVATVNPLGKVPALVLDDGRVVHDSKVIFEYLETLGRPPRLLPADAEMRILHKQIEAIADGICDAAVLIVLEHARAAEMRSSDWVARQSNKIAAGLDELGRLLGGGRFFTSHGLGLAEIATGCALGYLGLRLPEFGSRARDHRLQELYTRLMARASFAATIPTPQAIPEPAK